MRSAPTPGLASISKQPLRFSLTAWSVIIPGYWEKKKNTDHARSHVRANATFSLFNKVSIIRFLLFCVLKSVPSPSIFYHKVYASFCLHYFFFHWSYTICMLSFWIKYSDWKNPVWWKTWSIKSQFSITSSCWSTVYNYEMTSCAVEGSHDYL